MQQFRKHMAIRIMRADRVRLRNAILQRGGVTLVRIRQAAGKRVIAHHAITAIGPGYPAMTMPAGIRVIRVALSAITAIGPG